MTEQSIETSKTRRNDALHVVSIAFLLLLHLALVGYIAIGNSPNCDEVGHLTAGLHSLETGEFHLYRVNPPLVRLIAAIPTYLSHAQRDWSGVVDGPNQRPEWGVGMDFIVLNGSDAFWYFTAGRLLCLPFVVIGAWYCYLWSSHLYGRQAGLFAILLWMASPTVMTWGASFTPDMAGASLAIASAFHFWRLLCEPDRKRAFVAGLVLGVAETAKTTLVVLFIAYPLIWGFAKFRRATSASLHLIVAMLTLAVLVVNAVYGFEGTFTRLGEYTFVSRTFAGDEAVSEHRWGGNRFISTILQNVPIPLPYNYIRGIDLQKLDFEMGMGSYLCGVWSDQGWWYYYLVAWMLKEPVGHLAIFGAVVIWRIVSRHPLSLGEWVVVLPSLFIFILASSQCGISRYLRYVLPCFPAVAVFSSQAFATARSPRSRRGAMALLGWSVAACLGQYPHVLGYFNEIAGGSRNGYRYLLDANVDWGQDLFRVRDWVLRHPEVGEPFFAHYGWLTGKHVGIRCKWPIPLPPGSRDTQEPDAPAGWYIMSLNELFNEKREFTYLHSHTPVAYIGNSYWVYHIEEDE